MLTKTSLIVFIIFVGQLGYIVISDSEKNRNIYFLVAKSEKTYKNNFRTNRYNGFLNRGPIAEVESTIRPLPLVRLIKSAVAPLLIVRMSVWRDVYKFNSRRKNRQEQITLITAH